MNGDEEKATNFQQVFAQLEAEEPQPSQIGTFKGFNPSLQNQISKRNYQNTTQLKSTIDAVFERNKKPTLDPGPRQTTATFEGGSEKRKPCMYKEDTDDEVVEMNNTLKPFDKTHQRCHGTTTYLMMRACTHTQCRCLLLKNRQPSGNLGQDRFIEFFKQHTNQGIVKTADEAWDEMKEPDKGPYYICGRHTDPIPFVWWKQVTTANTDFARELTKIIFAIRKASESDFNSIKIDQIDSLVKQLEHSSDTILRNKLYEAYEAIKKQAPNTTSATRKLQTSMASIEQQLNDLLKKQEDESGRLAFGTEFTTS